MRQVEENEKLRRENDDQLIEIRSTNGELAALQQWQARVCKEAPRLCMSIHAHGWACGANDDVDTAFTDYPAYATLQALLAPPPEQQKGAPQ
jgi:hypothetical protein